LPSFVWHHSRSKHLIGFRRNRRETVFLIQSGKIKTQSYSTAGSLKFTHHFGLNCFFTFGEQLILQDSVTQSFSAPPLSVSSDLDAAAVAAGDKLC